MSRNENINMLTFFRLIFFKSLHNFVAAYAQSLFSENLESSTVYSPYKYESASNLDNSEQTTPFYIYYDGQNAVVDENAEAVTTGSVTSERRGRYQSIRDQKIEGSAPRVVGPTTCKEKNERYAVPGSCDKYIECLVS